jgi:hypothetical protein
MNRFSLNILHEETKDIRNEIIRSIKKTLVDQIPYPMHLLDLKFCVCDDVFGKEYTGHEEFDAIVEELVASKEIILSEDTEDDPERPFETRPGAWINVNLSDDYFASETEDFNLDERKRMMKINRLTLRNIIKEEISRLFENDDDGRRYNPREEIWSQDKGRKLRTTFSSPPAKWSAGGDPQNPSLQDPDMYDADYIQDIELNPDWFPETMSYAEFKDAIYGPKNTANDVNQAINSLEDLRYWLKYADTPMKKKLIQQHPLAQAHLKKRG